MTHVAALRPPPSPPRAAADPRRSRLAVNKISLRIPAWLHDSESVRELPQEASVFRKLNVEDNVRGVLEYLDIPRAEVETRLRTLL